ncbi:MAG: ABC transporter ATP-binding protein [Gammaproteobacteria bacterium]
MLYAGFELPVPRLEMGLAEVSNGQVDPTISSAPISNLFVRLWRHMGVHRQRQFVGLMALVILSAFAEVVSLGAVVPFIGILAAPDLVFRYAGVADLARAFGIVTAEQLVLPLVVLFAAAAVAAGALRMLLVGLSTAYTFASGAELSREIYRRTLYQPYRVHVARSSSEVISGIANKVGGTMLGIVLPMLALISAVVSLVAIVTALVVLDPLIALATAAGFALIYGLITWRARAQLRLNGQRISLAQTQVVKALQEGLGGIRDVLLDGTQPFYCDIYSRADELYRQAQGDNIVIANSPRYSIEALGMVLIAGLAYWLSLRSGGIVAALPILGALALGAQRLLPALQQTYSSWATIIGSQAILSDTLELLDQPLPEDALLPAPAPLVLERSVCLKAVRFRYVNDGPWVLDDLNLTILRGARVGIVGSTGSGKSTMLDVLMGLLTPTEGELSVDGQSVVGRRMRAWQRTIAHVPQNLYLADASVAENIAFGIPQRSIDMQRVREAARRAQIADFVESKPEGYDAFVGERGIRLSGGQRQRIGIARALYKEANVLVLDEATSALDNATEKSVMEAIEALDRDLTILLIAHRLTTVRHCDAIVQLENGRVVAQGSYDELIVKSHAFRHMVHAATP